MLREDHKEIRRLAKVVLRCYTCLEAGRVVPLADIEKITHVISEFLDSVHYAREEDSYFACVASYGGLNEEIRRFMIEHEFGRRVAKKISEHLGNWASGTDSREPVSRFLRTYHVYLTDHLAKEDAFFDEAQKILPSEEEEELQEMFRSVITTARPMSSILDDIASLESSAWYDGRL